MTNLESYFKKYRDNIIGIDHEFNSPYGTKKIIYADWIASGRLYSPIENIMNEKFAPFVGNTHSESSITGTSMTLAYKEARNIIKKHVNAGADDILLFVGSGMTSAVNKFQRILGFKICEQLNKFTNVPLEYKPIVFITHMEHHSNQTSWIETIADVEVIEPDSQGLIDLNHLEELLQKYKTRKIKIGSFTAASNVTGIQTPYYEMAKLMHENDGLCFVDFAASAPYVDIDMNPGDPLKRLDAIFFSPHKFLGGPGTSGVLIFNSNLYHKLIPDHPGGGTVEWTNPWGTHQYIKDIEMREDGGTPGFLQAIKAALCVKLKEEIKSENIIKREEELLKIAMQRLKANHKIHILANDIEHRLGILSFYVEDIHYNLMVTLLNDKFGIQVRGGCSCAGTYGHYLLHVDPTRSKRITDKINQGDLSEKPGWVRLSLHPTMTDVELQFILDGIDETVLNAVEWEKDYDYSKTTNEFTNKNVKSEIPSLVKEWFVL
ncbi:MAG: aminotransferase class V-fold PLP-dependent enzyme [Melioribacteraceae bacterium]|nr:aminotransferase class V-fold PLP-dependent enzyme [Melioribacteraceae bacterium]